jgi:hypothetical protein
MSSWIEDRVRAAAGGQLAAWIAGALLCGWGVAATATSVREGLGSPFDADASYLAAEPDAREHVVLRFAGTEIQETGIQRTRTSKQYGVTTSKETTEFWALRVGEKWLVVESERRPVPPVTGTLGWMGDDLRGELRRLTPGTDPGTVFHGEVLRTSGYVTDAWLAVTFLGGGLLTCLVFAVRAGMRLADPARHPAARRAASWGLGGTVGDAVRADAESAAVRVGRYRLGDEYAVWTNPFVFDVHRWDELLWAYVHVVHRRVYGVIPAGSSQMVQLEFEGGSYRIPTSATNTAAILDHAAERAPEAVIGHSDGVARAFKRGRTRFRTWVAEQRSGAARRPRSS